MKISGDIFVLARKGAAAAVLIFFAIALLKRFDVIQVRGFLAESSNLVYVIGAYVAVLAVNDWRR